MRMIVNIYMEVMIAVKTLRAIKSIRLVKKILTSPIQIESLIEK